MMDSQQDVVIIGGGVIGVCSAYYLAQKGIQATLIEKGEIASGCSYGNGGLIVPSHSVPLASPGTLGSGLRWLFDSESPFYLKPRFDMDLFSWLLRFALASRPTQMLRSVSIMRDLLFASRALYEELAETAGFDFGFAGKGSLLVYLSREKLQHEMKEVHLLESFEIPLEVMDETRVHDLEPALLPQVAGGIYYPRDGHINPHRFVTGLAEKAQTLGAEIRTNSEVTGFESSRGKITRIRTTRGDLTPKQVVLATGSWSPEVARDLKLRIPIQAAKGYSVTIENPSVCPKIPLLFGEALVVANPLGDSLRLAGTLELAGMDFSINSRRVDAMRSASSRYLPGLDEARVIEIWRGLRPCTPDGLPIISRSNDFENLIVAAGHAMLGMSLGPVTGNLVSQLVDGQKTEVDVSPFRMERF
jgi:D-amino-acid dehydrogenase